MKKVVITGATSMIGVALVKECIKNNIECLCVVRENSTKTNRLPISSLIKILECNLENMAEYSTKIKDDFYDVFFHLGWDGTSRTNRNNVQIQCKNIAYTLDAVCLAKCFYCKTFVGVGSQAEYGRVSGPISTNTYASAESAYGIAKNTAGRLSASLCAQVGMRHVWGRVFSIYGEWDSGDTLISLLINEISLGKVPKLTKSEQLWDYLYVADAGLAIRLIGEYGVDKCVYNIGSGNALPLRQYIEVVNNIINPNIVPDYGAVPYSENQVMHLCADVQNLADDTGFKPQFTFKQGIQRTISWWNEVFKL